MTSEQERLRAELLARIASHGFDITITKNGIEFSEEDD